MGIEQLNKAATAAGYSMAVQDDDCSTDFDASTQDAAARGNRGPVIVNSVQVAWMDQAAGWLRSCLPQLGGRAPA